MKRSGLVFSFLLISCCLGRQAEQGTNPTQPDRTTDAKKWFAEASAAYGEKDFLKAAELYVRVLDAGTTWPTVPYNAACCYARLGRTGDAFKYLELAVQKGWSDVEHLKSDADLESLRADPRWEGIVRACSVQRDASLKSMANPQLHTELLERMRTDQNVRNAQPIDALQLMRIDSDNTAWMREVIEKHGWPGEAMVGEEGAQAAWLLVQHADQDPAFQRRCLELLTQAHKKGDASAQHVAYLTDRVFLAEGKPQVYGTQFHTVDGKLIPRPIENEAEVDQRRSAMGLGSLAEYAEQMRAVYPP